MQTDNSGMLASQCSSNYVGLHRAHNKLKRPIKEDNIWASHDNL